MNVNELATAKDPDLRYATVAEFAEDLRRFRRGDPIGGIDEARAGGSLVFHSATTRSPEGSLVTDGGRILTVVGRGPDLASAQGIASAAADRVTFAGVQRRRDIAVAVPDGPARGSAPTVDAGRAVVSIR